TSFSLIPRDGLRPVPTLPLVERLPDAPREVLLGQAAPPYAVLLRLAERLQGRVAIRLIGLERVLRILRCAEERPDPAVGGHVVREPLEIGGRFVEVAVEILLQRSPNALRRVAEDDVRGDDRLRRRGRRRRRSRRRN